MAVFYGALVMLFCWTAMSRAEVRVVESSEQVVSDYPPLPCSPQRVVDSSCRNNNCTYTYASHYIYMTCVTTVTEESRRVPTGEYNLYVFPAYKTEVVPDSRRTQTLLAFVNDGHTTNVNQAENTIICESKKQAKFQHAKPLADTACKDMTPVNMVTMGRPTFVFNGQ